MNVGLLLSIGSVFKFVFYIFIALLVLLTMVTIHEFGHFIAGRLLGFKINEFAIGFGPAIFKRTTKKGMRFSIRIIPLGGFCAFDGEDDNSEDPNAFNNKKPWQRLIVLFNGAFFNFLSAVIFSFILLVSVGYGDVIQINKVNSAIANNYTNLQAGDIILEVNGVKCDFFNDNYFATLMANENYKIGDKVDLTIKRNGSIIDEGIYITKGRVIGNVDNNGQIIIDGITYTITVTDGIYKIISEDGIYSYAMEKVSNEEDNKELNFSLTYDNNYIQNFTYNIETKEVICTTSGIWYNNYVYGFGEALVKAWPFTIKWGGKVLVILGQLITGQLGIENVGGPILTISTIANYTQQSWIYLLLLFPLISVNLAVFNLLPFPALDGARMVFVTIEWIRKKPINRELEGKIHTIGLFILFAFVIFADVFNLIFK